MFKLLVMIDVKNFLKFEAFEKEAADIIAEYQGRILAAYEIARDPSGSGKEVHLVEFPDRQAYENYRKDQRFDFLNSLRDDAISAVQLFDVIAEKNYG